MSGACFEIKRVSAKKANETLDEPPRHSSMAKWLSTLSVMHKAMLTAVRSEHFSAKKIVKLSNGRAEQYASSFILISMRRRSSESLVVKHDGTLRTCNFKTSKIVANDPMAGLKSSSEDWEES
mmetsp:Transcript_27286/g.38072  ORF Transcript_27286/g.38072 Transcript_27286/m.38072 type:complete len:123 (-) Transcript_27286:721-1089(-)